MTESIYDLFDTFNYMVEDHIDTMVAITDLSKMGLDHRAAREVWASDECIIIKASARRNFDYYGGMEYVSRDAVQTIGDYVIYSVDADESGRVRSCLEHAGILEPDPDFE